MSSKGSTVVGVVAVESEVSRHNNMQHAVRTTPSMPAASASGTGPSPSSAGTSSLNQTCETKSPAAAAHSATTNNESGESVNVVTVPQNGGRTISASVSASAAADASAMPPPPPPTSISSSKAVSSAPSSVPSPAARSADTSSLAQSISGLASAASAFSSSRSTHAAPASQSTTSKSTAGNGASKPAATTSVTPAAATKGVAAVGHKVAAPGTVFINSSSISPHTKTTATGTASVTQKISTIKNATTADPTRKSATTVKNAASVNYSSAQKPVTSSVQPKTNPSPLPTAALPPARLPVKTTNTPILVPSKVTASPATSATTVLGGTVAAHLSLAGQPVAASTNKHSTQTVAQSVSSKLATPKVTAQTVSGSPRLFPSMPHAQAAMMKQPIAAHSHGGIAHGVTHVSLPLQSASIPDARTSSNSNTGGNSKKKSNNNSLRRGKWTSEEENYANRLISEFKAGLLPLTDGTTLRNFLSRLLNCDPMRISKKFVGNNCIGKQVFRRRVAEINRLTPDEIEKIREEISELEHKFYDRVAQTTRKASASVASGSVPNSYPGAINTGGVNTIVEEIEFDRPPTPPWLKPPANYRSPTSSSNESVSASTNLGTPATENPVNTMVPQTSLPNASVVNTSMMGAENHVLAQNVPASSPTVAHDVHSTHPATSHVDGAAEMTDAQAVDDAKSHMEKVMEAMQNSESALDQLARTASAEAIHRTGSSHSLQRTESALEQLARTASAAKFVEDIVNGESFEENPGRVKRPSHLSLQGSFEALMSLDVQSVENLVELANSSNNLASSSAVEVQKMLRSSRSSDGSCPNVAARMENFIKSLSGANLLKSSGHDSSVALGDLLKNIQNSLNDSHGSSNSLAEAGKIINRNDSTTGFTQLRIQGGLADGNSNSVEDFLSLMASGDIPHQDPRLLDIPLQKIMQQGSLGSKKQLMALASRGSLARLADSATNLQEAATLNSLSCGSMTLNKRKLDDTDIEQERESA